MAVQLTVKHDSRDAAFRFPLGAAEAGGRVRLAISVAGAASLEGQVRVWRDGVGETLVPLAEYARGENDTEEQEATGQPLPLSDAARWFGAVIDLPEAGGLLWYYFILIVDHRVYYYGNTGGLGGEGGLCDVPPGSFQITVYDVGAATPAWMRRAVMYQIFPDRFYREHIREAEKHGAVLHASWKDAPCYYKDPDTKEIIAYDFYGGNIAGVRAKLPYLKELGISVIYFNPVFEAESNHRYDTGDYKNIDPLLGTNEEFADFCREAKAQGIRVILDGVFSHTGSNSRYFNKKGAYDSVGAWQSPDSPYAKWYDFIEYPHKYHSWWGFDTLPNVKETEPSYMDFIITAEDSVLHHWAKLGVSGWRLDVIDELPPKFSQAFYRELKKTDKDLAMIGEVWEDASNKSSYGEQRMYLAGHEIDSAMNYPFRTILLDFLLGRADGREACRRVESLRENYPAHNFYAMMNLVGSHDVERVTTLLGEAPEPGASEKERAGFRLDAEHLALARARLEIAFVWQMTFPGMPSIYYGDEIAMQGYRDPYNRAPYDWSGGDAALRVKVREAVRLRNENAALSTGDFIPLVAEGDLYAYARVVRGGADRFGEAAADGAFVIALNRGRETVKVELPVGDFATGKFLSVYRTDAWQDAADKTSNTREGEGKQPLAITGGKLCVTLAPLSAEVWQEKKPPRRFPRMAGVLLHPTSFPSEWGIGDLGDRAEKFLGFLQKASQSVWQILPLGPVGPGNSPYQPPSAFAGNPLLLSPEKIAEDGWLTDVDLEWGKTALGVARSYAGGSMQARPCTASAVNYVRVGAVKNGLLRRAWQRFRQNPPKDFADFCEKEASWIDDYALFTAASEENGGKAWTEWEPALRDRDSSALADLRKRAADNIAFVKFQQYLFERQWQALHHIAAAKGVRVFGDMPLYLAQNSADVWAHRSLFALDEKGRPEKVAGVPPDYFSEDGQLWGNPLYNWDEMKRDNFSWWVERVARLLRLVDIVRIDHFRGLASYWEVDAKETTAKNGKWQKGPGIALLHALRQRLGDHLPIVAEDLGVQSDDVAQLLETSGLPGMKVIEFECLGNGTPRAGVAAPENCALYTGTHDNNTAAGWYAEDLGYEDRAKVAAWLGVMPETEQNGAETAKQAAEKLVELAYASEARLVIVPAQDILALGGRHRMNLPGTPEGNWGWRIKEGKLNDQVAEKLSALVKTYGR
ncbi:MAG: 4-alpha-glucanotransferase [Schwartzia sp.]|nr:4-alpha-glucanotransferase [Schwartzia sp. (in: firmicutes)]